MSTIKNGGLFLALGVLLALALAPVPVQAQSSADANCLTCHGLKDFKSPSGRSLYVDEARHKAGAHAILDCTTCHADIKSYPHPARIAQVSCESCHADQATNVAQSIHAALGNGNESCISCHGPPHEAGAAADLKPQLCASCHTNEVKDFLSSAHGKAFASGDAQAPLCWSCHGPVHKTLTAQDPLSPVAKKNQPDTCASCHSNADFLSKHHIPFAHPVESYKLSVHSRAIVAGDERAPSCSDCHDSHAIYPARDTRSKVNHWNIPATCGTCHIEIAKTYADSVHGQALKQGVPDAPSCTDCHGEHIILAPSQAESSVNPNRVSGETCGRCHGDERLNVRYNLPADRVSSYADSFHGLAMREGSQTVANCASCHGVHNIFRSSDPRSTVNPANLPKTCGQCHAGAGASFVIGPVHVQTGSGSAPPVVKAIRWTYWILIPLTLGFMVLHNLIDFLSKLIRRRPRLESAQQVVRMNLNFRIAHWGVMLSFPTLVFTGFVLKYPDAWWVRPLFWKNLIAFRGAVHRGAAILLIAATLYHLVHIALNRRDRAFLKAMWPRWSDFADLGQALRYNLGLSDAQPTFGKFNYAEKLEYWAFLWGTAVMVISGFLLWFNTFTLRHFPKWSVDAATAVHWYEALLATFSILLWHSYMVIFDPAVYPMDLAWLTGKVPADHYRHTRPRYLRLLELEQSNKSAAAPDEKVVESAEKPGDVPPEKDKP